MHDDPQENEAVEGLKSQLAMMGVRIDMCGGNCPVQIDGAFMGQPFYFRARGRGWRMWIGPGATVLRADALHEERAYAPADASVEDLEYAAGWMPLEEALGFVRECLERKAGMRA